MLNAIVNSVGIIAFACSGVFKGLKHNLDIFGITVLGVITACGGGIIRDILLNRMPTAIARPHDVYLAIVTSFLIYFTVKIQEKRLNMETIDNSKIFMRLVKLSDALGLALFTIIGANIAVKSGLGILSVAVMATITGVGGGIIRDLLVNEIPFVLKEDIYATLSFAGGIIYYICIVNIGLAYNTVVPLLFVLLLMVRLVAIKYKLSLHLSKSKDGESK
ncbi:trimeric intracellular cation channel family protein [Sebaldella sp. S0638]|uniref:trimeric intracellular cation channel family protein n=1 Tax=Sebaldella sp. S0638 TaxID=2957809 RepID=UPI00209F38A5|nr:trimeric intracellular cation channel family protein [Sebaldella sp. S0638]MCP1225572.1 trimeric intracellular cation channel family protein [Sebaldella sp. S0638]